MEGRTDGAQDSHCKVGEEEEDQTEKATTPRGNTQNTQKKQKSPLPTMNTMQQFVNT